MRLSIFFLLVLWLMVYALGGCGGGSVVLDNERAIELSYMIMRDESPSDSTFFLLIGESKTFKVADDSLRISFVFPPSVGITWNGDDSSSYPVEIRDLSEVMVQAPDPSGVVRIRRFGNTFSIKLLPSWKSFRETYIKLNSGGNQ